MTTLSTHVLDAALGVPAAAVTVGLHDSLGGLLSTAVTDADGRIGFDLELGAGTHRLVFDSGAYFAAAERDTFYPEITVSFAIDPDQSHYHVALLLSPFAYTTYRGS
ncbi:MAG: hydroxyisourate hydrolase [Actinomycetota bacterium]|nr:hydroxyisourate hydrolase [Actinomycetota bacterium]